MKKKVFGMVLFGLAVFAAISLIVMVLWNALVPDIFGLIPIGFWQASGLILLIRILFFGHGRKDWHRGHPYGFHNKRNELHQKWMSMSPEERQDFIGKRRAKFHDHFGRDGFSRGDFYFGGTNSAEKSDDH
jgi:hypothetical protein